MRLLCGCTTLITQFAENFHKTTLRAERDMVSCRHLVVTLFMKWPPLIMRTTTQDKLPLKHQSPTHQPNPPNWIKISKNTSREVSRVVTSGPRRHHFRMLRGVVDHRFTSLYERVVGWWCRSCLGMLHDGSMCRSQLFEPEEKYFVEAPINKGTRTHTCISTAYVYVCGICLFLPTHRAT